MNFLKLIKPLSAGVLPVAAALLLSACSKPAPLDAPVRSVKVLTVGVGTVQSSVEFAGEVRARVESRLGFRVAGKLSQRPVQLGEHVKAGQLLAQLDPQDYRLAADAARAQLAVAASNRYQAAADFKRFKELRDQNFISGAEFERRTTALKAAQAQYDQAQAQLASQGNQADYTRLSADVSGVVTAVEAEQGQVLAAGTPVVRIAQDGPRDVIFSVPEDRVAAVKTGSKVAVRVWASDTALQGVVREVAASADPVTRTFLVKVALSGDASPALGTTVTVVPQSLSHAGAPAIKVPTNALLQQGGKTLVWLLDPASMTVKAQPVEVLTADGNEVVIASGLTPGLQVVTSGVHVLSAGQKVTLYQEKVVVAPVNQAGVAPDSIVNSNASAAK
ncbi:efflux RND transporter periplasmic adaptor subunit [Rhodoferax sp. PAMC 29310]|uniref:efflux RND transporter periplasmic adaptor subunit n=1 Tax=Rhodoferax sp. PAMC 29310 TaxID=2822760 RepID=UPI001B33DE3D|nr:efflux RND transporter periplasmic adaptor subunit [Rhodoferax sp. PAMC 29310]